MKKSAIFAGLFLAMPAYAEDQADFAANMREKGVTQCAPAVNIVANWLNDKQGQPLSLWHQTAPNAHAAMLTVGRKYTDSTGLANITASPLADGGCDVTFAQTLATGETCTSLRETTFKKWAYTGEIAGLPLYDDPTTSNVTVTLLAQGTSCVIVKTGILFFGPEDLKGGGKESAAPEAKK
jgi:hypothetical protein